jgi:hypothetical protein
MANLTVVNSFTEATRPDTDPDPIAVVTGLRQEVAGRSVYLLLCVSYRDVSPEEPRPFFVEKIPSKTVQCPHCNTPHSTYQLIEALGSERIGTGELGIFGLTVEGLVENAFELTNHALAAAQKAAPCNASDHVKVRSKDGTYRRSPRDLRTGHARRKTMVLPLPVPRTLGPPGRS